MISIDLLVNPFGDSRFLVEDLRKLREDFVGDPFKSIFEELERRSISSENYLDRMLSLWCARIDNLREIHLFFIVDIIFDERKRPVQLNRLYEHTRKKLGTRFRSVYEATDTCNFIPQGVEESIHIMAYGEISDRCATLEAQALARKLREEGLQVSLELNYALCPDKTDGKFE